MLAFAAVGVRDADLWYSLRLAEPFASMAQEVWGLSSGCLDAQTLSRQRAQVGPTHELLESAAEKLGNPGIGLEAGRAHRLGDAGAIDYAMRSAATVGASLNVAVRFIRLVNDALTICLRLEDGHVAVELDSRIIMPAIAEDFILSALFHAHLRPALPRVESIQCLFRRPEPIDTAPYQDNFAPAEVRFDAHHSGFRFPAAWLQYPLETSEPKLHEILIDQAEQSLAALPSANSVTDRVRHEIGSRLSRGGVTIADAAQALQMSQRTLARRLEAEGTTFGTILDETRWTRAVRYLDDGIIGVEEVAFLLGFSQPTSFYRAFKRWTGKTPQQYRRRRGERRSD
ncbi:MAG: AraC family transcriptional regulator ligand-binding domain-containing protein [Myxococcales bacterium]|nr:AraC family transcriptional regulator ligand-binding domain-containing protein [Myxococcales bacterium]